MRYQVPDPCAPADLRTALYLLVAVIFICSGCTDASPSLVERARLSGTAEQWREWAAQVIARAETNSAPLGRSEWPKFVRDTANDGRSWHVSVGRSDGDTNGVHLVRLVSIGGFESIGVIIGPPDYVEIAPRQNPQNSTQIYPGIYVREVH